MWLLADARAAACAPPFSTSILVASATFWTPLRLKIAGGWALGVLLRSASPDRGGALGSFIDDIVRAEFPGTASLLPWTRCYSMPAISHPRPKWPGDDVAKFKRAASPPAGRMRCASAMCAGTFPYTCTAASLRIRGRSGVALVDTSRWPRLGPSTLGAGMLARTRWCRPAHLLTRAVVRRLAAPFVNGTDCLPAPARASSPTGARRWRPGGRNYAGQEEDAAGRGRGMIWNVSPEEIVIVSPSTSRLPTRFRNGEAIPPRRAGAGRVDASDFRWLPGSAEASTSPMALEAVGVVDVVFVSTFAPTPTPPAGKWRHG